MDRIYLVVSGAYSDKEAHCAFSDEQLANEYAGHLNTALYNYRVEHRGWNKRIAERHHDEYRVEDYDFYTELPVVKKEYL